MAPKKAATAPEVAEVERASDSTLPPPAHTLKGPDKERAAIWARQSKQGIISLCQFKEGDESCYHPLKPVRDPANSNDPMIEEVERNGETVKAAVHECSWHALAHGRQLVFPPKKEDEI